MAVKKKKTAAAKKTAKKAAPAKAKRRETAILSSPFEEMERWFENFYPRAWLRPLHWELPRWSELMGSFEARMPRVDVLDQKDKVVVRAEVPGVRKEDLDVSLSDHLLTIRGHTEQETTREEGEYRRREISRGSFSRSISLPADVDADKARATFENGVLELTLPKAPQARRRSIKIQG